MIGFTQSSYPAFLQPSDEDYKTRSYSVFGGKDRYYILPFQTFFEERGASPPPECSINSREQRHSPRSFRVGRFDPLPNVLLTAGTEDTLRSHSGWGASTILHEVS